MNSKQILNSVPAESIKVGWRQQFISKKGSGVSEISVYSFSFLAGGLYLPETVAVAELLRVHRDWQEVALRAEKDNLLRKRTAATRTRVMREIRYRLEQFKPKELEFFCSADPRDRRQLLFIAICRRFRFIREFVEEVLRPKTIAMDNQFYPADFARFWDRKGADAPEVEQLTEKSRAKVQQVLVRILAEAGLIDSTKNRRLQRPVPGKALARLVAGSDAGRLRFLLLSDADIRQLSH